MLFLVGFLIGLFYVELLYRMVRMGYASVYVSMPLRVFFFALLLALITLRVGLEGFLWLMGGFLSGFVIHLLVRGWLFNGLVKLRRTSA